MKKIALLLLLPAYLFSQKGEFKGVVTYFFNKYQGDKPDVGAKVFFIKNDTSKTESLISAYSQCKVCKQLIDLGYKGDGHCETFLKDHNATTQEGFEEIDKKTTGYLMKLEMNNDVKRTTVNGNGEYSISLDPGSYQIIFISKGRTDMTITEIKGKIDSKNKELKIGNTEIVDCRFDM